jgi:integrase
MAEANHSIHQKALIQLTTAAKCLAMLRSRQAIKDELRKQGIKITTMSAREITSWAMLYLDDHSAELLPAAIAEARRMILSGAMGKRAQKALAAVHKTPKIEQSRIERNVANGQFVTHADCASHFNRTVRRPNAELRTREHLTVGEVEQLIEVAASNRQGYRDGLMVLLAFRHGLRAAEVCDLRWEQIDFATATLHVRRIKHGTPATHPLTGRELRALRRINVRRQERQGRLSLCRSVVRR